MAGFSFYWLPSDEERFLDWLTTECFWGVAPAVMPEPAGIQRRAPVREFLAAGYDRQTTDHGFVGSVLLIGPEAVVRAVEPVLFDDWYASPAPRRLWIIGPHHSPLIRWKRGGATVSRIGQSTIGAEWTYPSQIGRTGPITVHTKDRDFRRWAERVLRQVRASTPGRLDPDRGWYANARLSSAVADGMRNGRIALHNQELDFATNVHGKETDNRGERRPMK